MLIVYSTEKNLSIFIFGLANLLEIRLSLKTFLTFYSGLSNNPFVSAFVQ